MTRKYQPPSRVEEVVEIDRRVILKERSEKDEEVNN
jgi:hypothetical protein